jgi:ferritin-like metal-binding protein YciE
MAINDPKELFVWMLSDLRQGAERSVTIFQELSSVAQDPDVKEALNARAYVSGQVVKTLDECFHLIDEKPQKTSGRLQQALVEDFRKELAEISSPEARRMFVLMKAIHLVHFRIAEYVTAIAAADLTGHYGVGVLLESCLADKLAFVERARRLIRKQVEERAAA